MTSALTRFANFFRSNAQESTSMVNTRRAGSESMFCQLPTELIIEIFDYLSDKDIRTILMVSKDVNVRINLVMEPRIRMVIYNIFRESGLFAPQPNLPLRVMKDNARMALNVLNQRKIETQERAKADACVAARRHALRDRPLATELSNIASTGVFIIGNTVPLVINCISDETIRTSFDSHANAFASLNNY